MAMKKVYLSLGSNVGRREENLNAALEEFDRRHIQVISRSAVYETEPQDVRGQPWFLNMAVQCETGLFPMQLLKRLQKIEKELGRVRGPGVVRRGPRTIDIDILLFANAVVNMPALTIPHPRMTERRFVLEPLLEIAPDLRHPKTREPLRKYLAEVRGQKLTRREATTPEDAQAEQT